MPLRIQGYCGVGRGLSGLHWVWCNGKGPHVELRQEPQASSPFLTSMAGSLQSWNRRVRPHRLLRNRTPLSSRVVHRVIGHLSSCIWNLRVFPDDATRVSVPLRVVTSSTGLHSKRSPGIGFLSRVDGEIGVFWNVARPTRPLLEFLCETSLLLRCEGQFGIPFQTKQGNQCSCGDQEGRRGSD